MQSSARLCSTRLTGRRRRNEIPVNTARSPKSRFLLLACVTALCAGAGLGFFAGSRKPDTDRSAEPSAGLPVSEVRINTQPDSQRALPTSSGASPAPESPAIRPGNAISPAQMVQRLRAETHPNRRRRELDELCASLDEAQLKRLLAILGPGFFSNDPFGNVPFEKEMRRRLIYRWAEIDPTAAADYAAGGSGGRDISAIQDVMQIWATSDIAAATQWAIGAKNQTVRSFGIRALGSALAEADPQAALLFLDELPGTENKSSYIRGMFRNLAQKNPTEAVELAGQLPKGGALRQIAVEQAASAWGEREPGKALAWYLQNASPPQGREDEFRFQGLSGSIIAAWVRTAPEEAAAFAAALPLGSSRSVIIRGLGENWGAVDPEAAAAWLDSIPKSEETSKAFEGLIRSWTVIDPSRAAAFVLSQPALRNREEIMGEVGEAWARQDPSAALAWARRQTGPALERLVAAKALAAMAAKDSPNSATYISQLKTAEARTEAIVQVAKLLGWREPERAAKWVMLQPEAQPTGKAIEQPVQSWAYKNSEAVAFWLNQQPAGQRKDMAIGAFAGVLAQTDGGAAAVWANTIADDDLRRQRVQAIVGTWAEKDTAAARAWVLEQGFTATEQQALLEKMEKAKRK